jgi:hypothetical protein
LATILKAQSRKIDGRSVAADDPLLPHDLADLRAYYGEAFQAQARPVNAFFWTAESASGL